MGNRVGAVVALVLTVALVAGTGCVGKSMYRKDVEDTDRRVGAVEDAVEANGRKIDDLGKETNQKIASLDSKASQAMDASNKAMGKATDAEKAAKGKLIWDVTLTDDGVKFDFGKANLSSSAIASLDKLIAKVKSYGKALYIEIEGHTDNVGDEALNKQLGWKRADVVKNYLNEKGIPLHAINTISFGESKPVADNSSKDGRAQNRRVVVRVLE
jgi:outer membrane protein OmpA-like peptidoglycan-associated protein